MRRMAATGKSQPGRLRRTWRDASLRRKMLFAVGLPVVWLVPTGVAAAFVQQQQAGVRQVARSENAALGALSTVELALVDAETGMRGYLATDDPSFLEPFEAAGDHLDQGRAALDVALGEDSDQADRLDALAATAVASIVDLVDDPPPPGPARAAALAASKEDMDAARAGVRALQDQIRPNLQAHRERIDELTLRANLVVASGLAVGSIAGLISLFLISTTIARRVTAVERNARLLAQGEPLEPTTPSKDELGRMTDELLRTSLLLEQRAADMTQSRDEAVRATRAKDRFLSRMSHELRTPLTSILGFGQLLQMEDLEERDREAVDQIVRSGRHLLDLINEILDIARIESGHLSLSLEPLALEAIVADCVAVVGPQAEAAGVTIEWSGSARIVADQKRTKQVLLNLLSNAIKYNAAEMHVTVTMEPTTTGLVRLSVTDTGMGIGAADQARLFKPFERLGAGATDIEGTGVGLALSRTLVEAMGGTIGVESERGRGSTFWLALPAAATAGAAATDADPGVATDGDDRPVVIYVDDDPIDLAVMERVFRSRPERLLTAMQGAAARGLAQRHRVAAVLIDLNLPDIGGEDLVRLFRADPATRSTPIVLVSGEVGRDQADMLRALGVEHQITKPLEVEQLTAVLDELVDATASRGGGRGR